MTDRFSLETAVARAARDVGPERLTEFRRLIRTLVYGPRFQFIFCECTDQLLRDRLIARVDEALADLNQQSTTVRLTAAEPQDHLGLEDALAKASQAHEVVHVVGDSAWWTDDRLDGLNVRREAIARGAQARLVFWMSAELLGKVATGAPDLWAWRTASVYSFDGASHQPSQILPTPLQGLDTRPLEERRARVAELGEWTKDETLDPELRAALLGELAGLLAGLGAPEEARRIRRDEELPLLRALGDDAGVAFATSQLAWLSDDSEHLRLLQEEVLPAYERLGDQLMAAAVRVRIAQLLAARGELDEALRILREEVLPVADGFLHPGLRAAALGSMAWVLGEMGDYDEAVRLIKEEELPTLEELGAVRERAVALGRLAGLLLQRGEVDEALRIVRQEQLPVFEQLGERMAWLLAHHNAALLLTARDHPGDREEARRHVALALPEAERMKAPASEDLRELLEELERPSS